MKGLLPGKAIPFAVLCVSLLFFLLGFNYPLLKSGLSMGPFDLKTDYIYITSSVTYFLEQDEVFIAVLLLLFTIILPVCKYLYLFITLFRGGGRHSRWQQVLEVINKWAMLDVFVVAILILNMKFGSNIIVSQIQKGTTFFAMSVVLLMITSYMLKIQKEDEREQVTIERQKRS